MVCMEKKTIIILHGWGLSGDKFAGLAQGLKNLGYQVFSPDLPGFGLTVMLQNHLELADYANFLDKYLREKKIKRPIVIGHSFGGKVALKFEQLYPNRLRALILSGTPGFTPVPKQKLMFFIALAKLGKLFFVLPPLTCFQNKVRRWYYYVVGAREFYRAQAPLQQVFKNVVQENLLPAMCAVKIPCLLVWGEGDTMIPVKIAKRMQQVISSATLTIIPSGDHGVPFKQPELFIKSCQDFLNKL